MIRSYRYRLYPTRAQEAELRRQIGVCVDIWNAALEQRKTLWHRHRISIGSRWCSDERIRSQTVELQDARADESLDVRTVRAQVGNVVLVELDRAFDAFFARRAGYPRFRSRDRHRTLVFPSAGQSHDLLNRRDGWATLRLGGVGDVRLRMHRPLPEPPYQVKQVVVKEKAGRWHASVAVEARFPERKAGKDACGLNRGLVVAVAVYDPWRHPELIPPDPVYPRYAEEIVALQRRISRCERGSRRRGELVRRLNRVWETVAARRRQRAYELAHSLLDRYGLVAIEDYDTAGMLSARPPDDPAARVRHLHRRIADAAWAEFARVLEDKASSRGAAVVRVPAAGISVTCPDCGGSVEEASARAVMSARERTVACACGMSMHVDAMAARNVYQAAARELEGAAA